MVADLAAGARDLGAPALPAGLADALDGAERAGALHGVPPALLGALALELAGTGPRVGLLGLPAEAAGGEVGADVCTAARALSRLRGRDGAGWGAAVCAYVHAGDTEMDPAPLARRVFGTLAVLLLGDLPPSAVELFKGVL